MRKSEIIILSLVAIAMAAYFLIGKPKMADDGFQYEGFAESLAHGKLDFKSFYGTQGLSILAVPIFWLTGSHNSIIITSIILVLLSIPLAFKLGRNFWDSETAGLYMVSLFLLTAFPYITLMRGFQEAAVLFFSLLIAYLSLKKSDWTPIAWAFGSIVKPFNLFLFPLFILDFLNRKKIKYLSLGVLIGVIYLGLNFYQTGKLLNDAVLTSYAGNYSSEISPPLFSNFTISFKNFARVAVNMFMETRKIMISPIVAILGLIGMIKYFRDARTKKFIFAFLSLAGFLALLLYSFPKYLLPNVVILSLFAIPFLIRFKWLMPLILADSVFVFWAIFQHYNNVFWSARTFYLPIIYAGVLYVLILLNHERPPISAQKRLG